MNSSQMPDTDNPKTLYSQELEYALVGSILVMPERYASVDVEPDDFYLRHLRPLWMAYGKLHKSGAGIDVATVMETLDRMGQLETVGGIVEIAKIASNNNYYFDNIETHARIVKDYSCRCAWLEVAGNMARLAYDREKNLEQEAPAVLSSLSTAIRTKGAAQHISQFTRLVLDEGHTSAWQIPKTSGGYPPDTLTLTGLRAGCKLARWSIYPASRESASPCGQCKPRFRWQRRDTQA